MFTEVLKRRDEVVAIVCEGRLTRADLHRLDRILRRRLHWHGRRGLLLDFTLFAGFAAFADPRAVLGGMPPRLYDFDRAALLGDRRWTVETTALAKALTRASPRWFELGMEGDAAAWTRMPKRPQGEA